MKKIMRFLVLSFVAAIVALPAVAGQSAQPQGTGAAQAAQTDEQAKTQLYEQFLAARKKWKDNANAPTAADDYKAAYEIGKDYVAKFGAQDDDYAKYVKNFVSTYENYQKTVRKSQVDQLLKDKKYTEAFAAGKQVLAEEPNDLGTLYLLSRGAVIATTGGNEALNGEATGYAKKAIQLVEQGKSFQEGTPLANKDEVLAILNYGLGLFTRKSAPAESAGYFFKAAQYNSALKTDAQTYGLLAGAYESDYENVAKDFAAKYADATARETPEGKAAQDKVNAVTDRLIDAYARAVAYAGNDTKYAELKPKWLERLTELYKYRHEGSDAGLKELIASVTSKPLPTLSGTATPAATSSSTGPSGTR
jgi:hypothetical protein